MTKIEIIEREIPSSIEVKGVFTSVKLKNFFKNSYKLIYTTLQENKSDTSLPPYARYSNLNWQEVSKKKSGLKMFIQAFTIKWNVAAGTHCSEDIKIKDPIIRYSKENSKYIRTIHKGSYMKVGKTYQKLLDFAHENNLELEPESFEFYINDPAKVKQKDLETEVLIPIK